MRDYVFVFENGVRTQPEPQPVGRDQMHILSVLLLIVLNFEMHFREIDL